MCHIPSRKRERTYGVSNALHETSCSDAVLNDGSWNPEAVSATATLVMTRPVLDVEKIDQSQSIV
jgi:hypothetical protein